ncbi:TPA_asm: M [Wurfbainia alphacytorhabdovirus 1]|nr:TPA_asm: M [Wurfbainia alphacytorhabdovirus 1]
MENKMNYYYIRIEISTWTAECQQAPDVVKGIDDEKLITKLTEGSIKVVVEPLSPSASSFLRHLRGNGDIKILAVVGKLISNGKIGLSYMFRPKVDSVVITNGILDTRPVYLDTIKTALNNGSEYVIIMKGRILCNEITQDEYNVILMGKPHLNAGYMSLGMNGNNKIRSTNDDLKDSLGSFNGKSRE